MDNVFSVFRTNEILLTENEGLDGSTLIPIELGGKLKLPAVHQVNNKARIVSIMDLGKMLLHCAREGETHKVHELMSRGAPFTTDWLGTTPLHVAAEKNHLSTCEVLLRAGISKDARTKVDRTPLHFAVFEGHEQIVQLLLRHSCDVNAKDMLKMTPLHWAVQKGYKNIAKLLLKNGADPNAVSKFSKTPITLAAELDQNDLYHELMMQNLQRSDLEQQQAADTLIHELNARLKPDPDLIIEDEMDVDDMNNTVELDVIQSSPESSTAFTSDFDSFSTKSDHQSTTETNVKPSPKEAYSANASTLALLKEHGIAMQEDIENTLITSALQSGRQLVLSDAGKLLLNDPKFKKASPTIGKQSTTTTLQLTSLPTTTTTISTTPKTSTIRLDNVKRKPAILTSSKTMPLEANKVSKVMSAEQFHLMVGSNGANFNSSKTPNGLIRYQAIKNSNVMTQLVKRKNPIIPNSKIKLASLTGTLKTPNKLDNSNQSRISINTSTSSTIPKEANPDMLSRLSFNIIGNTSTNLPQTTTTISPGQPYTVKLVSLPQTTATTFTKPKTQIVRQLNQSVVQSRPQQQPPPSTSNGATPMSDIEKKVIELEKLTHELRKQNEEYKFRLEKLENETEREREERLSRQYTNS